MIINKCKSSVEIGIVLTCLMGTGLWSKIQSKQVSMYKLTLEHSKLLAADCITSVIWAKVVQFCLQVSSTVQTVKVLSEKIIAGGR